MLEPANAIKTATLPTADIERIAHTSKLCSLFLLTLRGE
jgi:hypothetical protein